MGGAFVETTGSWLILQARRMSRAAATSSSRQRVWFSTAIRMHSSAGIAKSSRYVVAVISSYSRRQNKAPYVVRTDSSEPTDRTRSVAFTKNPPFDKAEGKSIDNTTPARV